MIPRMCALAILPHAALNVTSAHALRCGRAGALRRAVIDGDIENGSLMAGQSVGMLKEEEPVAEIIAKLMAQSEGALSRR
jgi:NAD(P)H-dependent flavin oxidoreductase YrpB (nitropropane dioxygenase family)